MIDKLTSKQVFVLHISKRLEEEDGDGWRGDCIRVEGRSFRSRPVSITWHQTTIGSGEANKRRRREHFG